MKLLKDLQPALRATYKEVCQAITSVYPEFRINAGPNTHVTDEQYEGVVKAFGGDITNWEAKEQTSTVEHKVAPNSIKLEIPHGVLETAKQTAYDLHHASVLTIEDIKIEAETLNVSVTKAIENAVKNKYQNKIKIGDTLLHDVAFLQGLFGKYQYIIIPVSLNRKSRQLLQSLCSKSHLTESYNDRIIAVVGNQTLTVFI